MQNAQLDTTAQKEVTYPHLAHEDPLQTQKEIRMYQIASLAVLDIIVIQMPPLSKRDLVILVLFVSWVGPTLMSSSVLSVYYLNSFCHVRAFDVTGPSRKKEA